MSTPKTSPDPPGPLRILVVHNRYRSHMASGENRVVEQEIALLRSAGHEVLTYLRDSDDIERSGWVDRVKLPARVVWSLDDARAIRRLVARARPDVTHVHNTFPLISPSAIRAVAEARVPCVMTLHNMRLFCANAQLFRDGHPCHDCLGGSAWPGLLHACYRDSRLATAPITASIAVHRRASTWDRVDRFVAPSEFLRRTMIAGGLPSDRVVVKPNFTADPSMLREGAGETFLYLGRLSSEKGVDRLIRSWRAGLGRLVIAGDGPDRRELESAAERSGADVRFLGQRTPDECSTLLRSARALVLPSRVYEVFPVAVVEAFAHAVPVVAPAHGPFVDIVEDGVTGRLFEPGDPESLAGCLAELLDADRSIRLGRNARKEFETRYTQDRNLEMLEAVYRSVLADGRNGPGASARRRDALTSSSDGAA